MKCITDVESIARGLAERVKDITIEAMASAGERAVSLCKSSKTYKDVSHDLTNSIGYGVVKNGQLVRVGGFGGGNGGSQGIRVLTEASGRISDGLIIVAGMEYALYVERKGYVVLDGGTLDIDKDIADELRNVWIK